MPESLDTIYTRVNLKKLVIRNATEVVLTNETAGVSLFTSK